MEPTLQNVILYVAFDGPNLTLFFVCFFTEKQELEFQVNEVYWAYILKKEV